MNDLQRGRIALNGKKENGGKKGRERRREREREGGVRDEESMRER